MKNVMVIDGQRAVIEYDPEIEMFRGEFSGLNGSADFYAKNITGLKQERGLDCRKPKPLASSAGIRLRSDTSFTKPIS